MHMPRVYQVAACILSLLSIASARPADPPTYGDSTLDYFVTADGATYAYNHTPANGTNPTYLLLHGYPSTHKDWDLQVAALTAQGFGTIVPDMLGFGASDMPTKPIDYNAKRLTGHLAELLDHENVDTVIGVGHDWGSVILSRFAVYHQDRLDKIAWVNVGYQAPGGYIDLDAINANAAAEYGYMPLGYWYFFTRYDAGTVIGDHLESHFHLIFPVNHTIWETNTAPLGGARAWLQADIQTENPAFVDEAYKAHFLEWMSLPNAVEAGLNCYRSQYFGFNDAAEAKLTDEDWMLHVPVLAIAGAQDAVARPEFMEATRPWAKAGYQNETLNGGHWLFLELPDQLSELLVNFGRA